jgi:AraC-like DNA-binding protein
MTGTEYRNRLQYALEYIENHLESEISLDDLAASALYSPGHFIWIFHTVTGYTPMEYVRHRKMTEAARAILTGDDIVDTAFRYGFSAQDAFTRSFHSSINMTPGHLREFHGENGTYTPKYTFSQGGKRKMLGYNLDCDSIESVLRIEKLLTDEVKELVYRVAIESTSKRMLDPYICNELCQARIFRTNGDTVHIDTAVFLEDDLLQLQTAVQKLGRDLAQRIITLNVRLPEMQPGIKRLVIGMNGLDQGVFELLISGGYAFDHRSTKGRYAGAKVDFYEVCDAYDRFGPYISGGYGFRGDRYAVKIIGQDHAIYDYMNAGSALNNNKVNDFQININKYLVDVLGGLLRGEISSPSLAAAAEAMGWMKSGKAIVPVITKEVSSVYSGVVKQIHNIIRDFMVDTSKQMNTLLKDSTSGRQGVSPDKLMVDLMRYVRMATHKELYDSGVYTDSLPDGGNITIFRELDAVVN